MIIHLTTKQEIWLNEHQEKTDCFGTQTGFAPAIAYRGIVSSINSRFANPAILTGNEKQVAVVCIINRAGGASGSLRGYPGIRSRFETTARTVTSRTFVCSGADQVSLQGNAA